MQPSNYRPHFYKDSIIAVRQYREKIDTTKMQDTTCITGEINKINDNDGTCVVIAITIFLVIFLVFMELILRRKEDEEFSNKIYDEWQIQP